MEFFLHNPIAIEFHDWLKDTQAAEEFFYATLVRVASVDGAHGNVTVKQDVG